MDGCDESDFVFLVTTEDDDSLESFFEGIDDKGKNFGRLFTEICNDKRGCSNGTFLGKKFFCFSGGGAGEFGFALFCLVFFPSAKVVFDLLELVVASFPELPHFYYFSAGEKGRPWKGSHPLFV